jgi:hypothetical protein
LATLPVAEKKWAPDVAEADMGIIAKAAVTNSGQSTFKSRDIQVRSSISFCSHPNGGRLAEAA